MRRFGDADRFLELVGQIRAAAPEAGLRSNVIVGFPGETDADLAELERFLIGARLDAVGVFGYSDEDGTEAARLDGKHDEAVIRERTERVSTLADELTAQRADDRLGETVDVMVESLGRGADGGEGRAAHQAPEVDGATTVHGAGLVVGRIVAAKVVATDGVDLVAEVLG
jgi:tRNA A37 methylthiotransferase MiaB